MSDEATAVYVGQVERDSQGLLWAVLYFGADVVTRERVSTLRRGKRRVADQVLSAADGYPGGPGMCAPTPLNGLVPYPASTRWPRHVAVPRNAGLLRAAAESEAMPPARRALDAFTAPARPN